MRVGDLHTAREQIVDDLLVAGLLEESVDRARHFAADVRYELEDRPRQVADQTDLAEP